MRTVLVVEDDRNLRETLQELLGEAGYPVASAANGLEAAQYLYSNDAPGLIVLDLMMPVMDGWTLRERLLQHPDLARIPIAVMSAALSDPDARNRLKAVAYLRKPFEVETLIQVVERYCAV